MGITRRGVRRRAGRERQDFKLVLQMIQDLVYSLPERYGGVIMYVEECEMKRTTVMLPPELKAEVTRTARKRRVSLGQFIRESLKENLKRPPQNVSSDSLLDDDAVFTGSVPRNISKRHDDYLYGTGE